MKTFGIVGWKNSGKTGLMERLVAEITARGFMVSTVKHAHHTFDIDQSGKDSHRHRVAGANEVLLASAKRWALMHENRGEQEAPLSDLLAKLSDVDLVLIEGYKRDNHAKVEAHRAETKQGLLATEDATVTAVASNYVIDGLTVLQFDLDDVPAIASYILKEVGLE